MNSFVAQTTPYLPAASRNVTDKFGRFVCFSPETTGSQGRKVLIDIALIPKFLALVDPSSHDGMAITKHIIQMRSLAGGFGSCDNLRNAFLHMDEFRKIRIFYKIIQASKSESSRDAGVYITDIRSEYSGSSSKAGFYRVKPKTASSAASFEEMLGDKILDHHAAISDQSSSLEEAVEQCSAHTKECNYSNTGKYSMFFINSYLYNELGVWITPAQKTFSADSAAKKLANALVNTQSYRQANHTGKQLKWVVMGDGAKLLEKAMSYLPSPKPGHKESLHNHYFQFVDPTINITALSRDLLRTGASFSDKPVISGNKKSRSTTVTSAFTRGQNAGVTKDIGKHYQTNLNPVINEWLSDTQTSANIANVLKNYISAPISRYFIEVVSQANRMKKW